ncbi:DUF448 domain-containing protein [Geoalkalibacter sp.]|uniref:DUF448 domain-containing protein n=1 Tax=Geoalkalibacter sp. TaxID=3041440 RepID=UPI00272E1B0C|nr:DUF448 domain-containing protein [Geoalkalibacter sp.]
MKPEKDGPQRTCLGCRKALDKNDLVRYVLSAAGDVVVDFRQKLPGRGAYTCVCRACVTDAVRRDQFSRAYRGKNRRPESDTLIAQIHRQLGERVEGLLGMARKAGMTVGGSNLTLASMDRPGELGLVIVAGDMSEGILEKIRRKCQATGVPLHTWGEKASLGRLMGRDERSVIGVKQGKLAEALSRGLERYKQFVGEI